MGDGTDFYSGGEWNARAVAKTMQLVSENKNAYCPLQFANPANPEIHAKTTAEEIWADTDGSVDIVVSGVGTAGTISGVGRVLKLKKPSVRMVAIEPGNRRCFRAVSPDFIRFRVWAQALCR